MAHLNIPRLDHRVKSLLGGKYTRFVNCCGIIPYLYGVQDNPIYLEFDEMELFLSKYCTPSSPLSEEQLEIGDVVTFGYLNDKGESTIEHAIIKVKNDSFFEKKGMKGKCRYIPIEKNNKDTERIQKCTRVQHLFLLQMQRSSYS